jgi:hypothetical protein
MRIRDERLPWLADEPAPEPAGPAKRVRTKSSGTTRAMWPWYFLLLLLVGAVAAGAWWLGTRQREAPPPQLPAEQTIAVPVVGAGEPVNAALAELPPEPLTEALPQSVPQTSDGRTDERRAASEPAAEEDGEQDFAALAETDGTDAAAPGRPVFPAEDAAAAPPPRTGPTPVVVYHPQINRGRVVQLGAFPSRAQAEATWKRVTRRYPYLASKPKMVNTVDVRALGGGRRTRMYRLQLGTSSQAQSAVICQQLERAGQSCVVVY